MLNALNASSILRTRYNIGQTACHQCTKTDKNNDELDPPIKALPMAYNSYENQSSDQNVAPVIIMHGKSSKCNECHFSSNNNDLSCYWQAFSDPNRIGEASARLCM